MKRSSILVLVAFVVGVTSLTGAPRITSVDSAAAAPGDSLTAGGTDLNEVELLFLTVGNTDVKVKITGKTAEEIQFQLPTNVPHGQYRLMLQTGGNTPALLVQPVICEVMSAADVAKRKAELEKEEIGETVAPAEETPPEQ